MKAIAIGIGVLGAGCALWLAVSGGVNLGKASRGAFNYETASLEQRQQWLNKHAEPMAKLLNRSLPKGNGAQPHMSVHAWSVNARRRAITVQVRVKGQYGIDKRAVPAAKKAMVAQVCPSYAKSPLGENKVNLFHSFLGKGGREELSFVISPIVSVRRASSKSVTAQTSASTRSGDLVSPRNVSAENAHI